MVPKHSFLKEISSCLISTVPDGFYDQVDKGSIQLKKAQSFGFCKQGILVDGEVEPVKVDVVILSTGFRGIDKLKHLFSSPTFQDYIAGSDNSTVPLYRWFSTLLVVWMDLRMLTEICIVKNPEEYPPTPLLPPPKKTRHSTFDFILTAAMRNKTHFTWYNL